MTKLQRWAFVSVVVLAALLRFVALERVPYGVNQDEASRAYDAYSLLETGHDQHGNPWPLTLESFSRFRDNASAIAVYAAIPTTAVLGPGVLAVRIPSAVAGVLAVLAVGYVGFALSRRWEVGILASFLLAVSPWHLTLSRTGHEAIWASTLFILGLAALLHGLRRPPFILLAATAWAAALYGYPIAKLFVPLAGLTFAIVYWPQLRPHWRWVTGGALLGLILLLPALAHQGTLPDAGRLDEILIFTGDKPAWLPVFALNLLRYIDPSGWLQADLTAGPLDWLAALFGIVLFWLLGRSPVSRRVRVLGLLCVFLSILPAAVTDSNPSQIRASYLVLWVAIFGGWGLWMAYEQLAKSLQARKFLQVGALVILSIGAGLGIFWIARPAYALRQGYARSYMPYTPMAKDIVHLLETKYANVPNVYVVSDNLNQIQVFFQTLRPWPPQALGDDIHISLQSDFWYYTDKLGRYSFCKLRSCPVAGESGIYVQLATQPALGKNTLDRLVLPKPVANYAWYVTHD